MEDPQTIISLMKEAHQKITKESANKPLKGFIWLEEETYQEAQKAFQAILDKEEETKRVASFAYKYFGRIPVIYKRWWWQTNKNKLF